MLASWCLCAGTTTGIKAPGSLRVHVYMSELKLFKIKSPSPPLRSPIELGCLVATLFPTTQIFLQLPGKGRASE